MKVVIIGTGNVATVLGKMILQANHQIIQVLGRNIAHAQTFARELNCPFTDEMVHIDMSADIYMLAIADTALLQLPDTFILRDKLIMHTAGSVSREVLKPVSDQYGVLYPLQSLRKENMQLPIQLPLLIDGNNEVSTNAIQDFALSLSSIVSKIGDEQRLKLHVAAVVVSNFTNHLYRMAADFCQSEGLDFGMLQALIEETAQRLRTHLPGDMQTGPAIRKDLGTVNRHLEILSAHPQLKQVYQQLSESIMQY